MRRTEVWTHDITGDRSGVLVEGELLELYRDQRLDQSDQLIFDVYATSIKRPLLVLDGELEHDHARFYIDELEDNRKGNTTVSSVTANALWYRLGDVTRPGSTVIDALTAAAGLDQLLAGTDWTVSMATTPAPATFSMEEKDRSVLALLRTWARITGTYLRFDTMEREVALVEHRGRTLGTGFRYGRNVESIRRRSRPPEVTRLYPYGAQDLNIAGLTAGGVEYIENLTYYTAQGITLSEARERFTRSRVFSDSSFVDESALLAAATARLDELSQAVVSYECKVIDLAELTGVAEVYATGDEVRVVDPDFGDDIRTTVVRVKRYPLEPWRNGIELAYMLNPVGDGSAPARSTTPEAWEQFVQSNLGESRVRNEQVYNVARIPLSFRKGGRANYHLDINAVGVGAGTMYVDVVDALTDVVQHRALEIPYTDGELVHESAQWAYEELNGSYDYRVRVSTSSVGGPSATAGVDVAADECRFWILAQGAVRQSPATPNSVRYDGYTTATFEVPEGVTEVTIEAVGASGSTGGGAGGRLVVLVPVTPGEMLDVVAASTGGSLNSIDDWVAGQPNGGQGGRTNAAGNNRNGHGGGGSSHVVRSGLPFSDALVVAGGGGGRGRAAPGGQGGYFLGGDGGQSHPPTNTEGGGFGATQLAGGAAGGGDDGDSTSGNGPKLGSAGTFGEGGDSSQGTGSANDAPGGGGGGGWYGGGGGSAPFVTFNPVTSTFFDDWMGGGGGGGSGWVHPSDASVLEISDGSNVGNGYVVISWDTPD